MELKHRKKINNSLLPHFYGGLNGLGYQGIPLAQYGYRINVPQTISVPNTQGGTLPNTTNTKASSTLGKAGNIITSAINFTGSAIDAYTLDRSEGQIEANAGNRNVYAGDWAWLKLNDIDRQKEMDELRKQNTSNTLATTGSGAALGAAIGSIFPGAGTIIGGAIGAVAGLGIGLLGGSSRSHKLRKRMYNAQLNINRSNNYAFASAQGDYLNQDYDLNHAYTQDDQLYVANAGKDLGGTMKKKLPHYAKGKVASLYGLIEGSANSIVGHEPILDLEKGFGYMAPGEGGSKENTPSIAAPGDNITILSYNSGLALLGEEATNSMHEKNKPALRLMNLANKYSDYLGTLGKQTNKVTLEQNKINVKPELDYLTSLAEILKKIHANSEQVHAADGLNANELGIPGWMRAIPTAAGLLAGWNQLNWWKRQPINMPDIYAANPNEGRALSALASIRSNPYGPLRQMQDVERRAVANTNGMGGLSGSQRYLANVASTLGLQRNYADILNAAQAQNNQYKANYASSALLAGQADAARRQEANQFGYNAYTAAHGRKVKGVETGIANILNAMNSGYANEFKYRMGNKTLGMYQQSLDEEKKRLAAEYNKPTYVATPTYAPTYTYTPTLTYRNWRYAKPDISQMFKVQPYFKTK